MRTIVLDTKQELESHEAAIERLFVECFGDRMSLEVWRWAYLANPHGDPWVTVCYDGDAMVGHYAMIPMPVSADGQVLPTCLSMTTMVAATHRQHGLFVKLATATYERARAAGVAWVMGFPNDMSAPGFERRLGWQLGEPERIVTLDEPVWRQAADQLRPEPGLLRLNLRDDATRAWRLSRPGSTYQWQDGLAWKRFGDTIDVLSFEHPAQLAQLPARARVNLLLPAAHPIAQGATSMVYRFGGTSLAQPFGADRILREMALSDLF